MNTEANIHEECRNIHTRYSAKTDYAASVTKSNICTIYAHVSAKEKYRFDISCLYTKYIGNGFKQIHAFVTLCCLHNDL